MQDVVGTVRRLEASLILGISMLLVACGGESGGGGGGGDQPSAPPGATGPVMTSQPAGTSTPGAQPGAQPGTQSGTQPGATPGPAAGSLAIGQKAYVANCANCHGKGGAGDGPFIGALPVKPRSFAADEWRFVDFTAGDAAVRAEIERVIREGIADAMMPGYGGPLSDEQIAGLVEYVLQLRKQGRGG